MNIYTDSILFISDHHQLPIRPTSCGRPGEDHDAPGPWQVRTGRQCLSTAVFGVHWELGTWPKPLGFYCIFLGKKSEHEPCLALMNGIVGIVK